MRKKDEIKIEMLSRIDDEIIEKQSIKRYELMNGNKQSFIKKKRMISIVAIAAAFAILVSVMGFVIVPLLWGKQVPVYEGMTIVNEEPAMNAYYDLGVKLLSGSDSENPDVTDAPVHSPKKPVPPSLKNSLNLEGNNGALYYANKNEDIYINIHISNPDQFEILSFTLNGIKYQSYMFESGSTSEKLILKLNVGDSEGLVEYTIDAIKYVDGEKIKDVRMEGDKTVKIGVCPNEQPSAAIDNQTITPFSMDFDVTVSDTLGLISGSSGKVFAVICDGENVVSQKEIIVGEKNSVSVEGLTPGKAYRKMIVACYDSFDGNGFDTHILFDEEFYTESLVEIIDAKKEGSSKISFDLILDTEKSVKITNIDLIFGEKDTTVMSIGPDARLFEEVIYSGIYKIRVTYTYEDNGIEKTGFSKSVDEIHIGGFGESDFSADMIIKDGKIIYSFSGDTHIYNPSTEDYRAHLGIDIEGSDNIVRAAFSGTVTNVIYDTDLMGNTVEITSTDKRIVVYYKSLDEISVKIGDEVAGGSIIGTAGRSMNNDFSSLPHVHIEIFVDGKIVDPGQYIK